MNASNRYKVSHFILWSREKIVKMVIISTIPTLLFYFLGWKWLAVPWVPIALLGTATAFISGFRNTQTYGRLWEARQIYGSIINNSRTFAIMVKDFIRNSNCEEEKKIHKELFYRHFAWLTALRFQLREVKVWENVKTRSYNRRYLQFYKVPEWESDLGEELKTYISENEVKVLLEKKNRATQIIASQSETLRKLHESGSINDFNYTTLENQLKEFYDQQGKCERIKNFPYPRQFSTINTYFTNLFCLLLPLGFLNEFAKLDSIYIWFTIPFSILLGWVFLVLEQIGESCENPFEGSANDIPITQISRMIEIDLRDMLNEKDLPPPIQPINGILM
ncbi:multidrug transporter [Epilithonimonas sp. JDS]|uniref:bestrophin family protein n=1 Tax=Epilithonimonas sp. JDS TaxID=2902797 RepID=UPI001E3CA173|nr:bestrophin family ion channel [Epilithonimonas sp. JDS]MCD9853315.1 multidrug transporter [Epilithonimonas sp. JDS]